MILPGSLRPWLLCWTGFESMSPNQQMRALPIGLIREQKNVAHNHISPEGSGEWITEYLQFTIYLELIPFYSPLSTSNNMAR